MKQIFLLISVIVLISGCQKSNTESVATDSLSDTNETIIPKEIPEPGYSIVYEKILLVNKKDYKECRAAFWDLKIPVLLDLPAKDARNIINDSINKIVNQLLKDTLNYENGKYEIAYDCDTTDASFIPDTYEIHYQRGKNSEKLLSLDVRVNFSSGGGGNGFGTELHSFNIDLVNNKILLINDLFDTANTEQLVKYVSENIESPNESISLDEEFKIFHSPDESWEYGEFDYVGFRIDKTSLVLCYSMNYGRGNGINEIALPLKDIKPFIKKEYQWICEKNE